MVSPITPKIAVWCDFSSTPMFYSQSWCHGYKWRATPGCCKFFKVITSQFFSHWCGEFSFFTYAVLNILKHIHGRVWHCKHWKLFLVVVTSYLLIILNFSIIYGSIEYCTICIFSLSLECASVTGYFSQLRNENWVHFVAYCSSVPQLRTCSCRGMLSGNLYKYMTSRNEFEKY